RVSERLLPLHAGLRRALTGAGALPGGRGMRGPRAVGNLRAGGEGMRVWLAADDSACGYWRMRLPQAHLGDEVEFVDVETVSACYLEDDVLEVEPPDVDVAVFQRPVRARALELIEALQRAGTAV